MKVLVVGNNKGGVGKTSISILLSIYFAREGYRTLGIDFDPQCNFSRHFVDMEIGQDDPEVIRPPEHPEFEASEEHWHGRNSSADIFGSGFVMSYPTVFEKLEVIPGHSKDLLNVERVTQQEMTGRVHKRLDEWFTTWESDLFDIVIIDTGPSKGPLTTAALQAASDIVIPAEMEELSIEGLYGMLAYWSAANLMRPKERPLNLLGILANKFDTRLPLHQHFYDSLAAHPSVGTYLLPVVMHNWQDYKEATMTGGTPVLQLAPGNRTRREAEKVCKTLMERMYGTAKFRKK